MHFAAHRSDIFRGPDSSQSTYWWWNESKGIRDRARAGGKATTLLRVAQSRWQRLSSREAPRPKALTQAHIESRELHTGDKEKAFHWWESQNQLGWKRPWRLSLTYDLTPPCQWGHGTQCHMQTLPKCQTVRHCPVSQSLSCAGFPKSG